MKKLTRRQFIKTAAAAAPLAAAGCGLLTQKTPAVRKPNIVFVLTDQWRAQATGYAGDPNVKTPNLDALASRSINFENAVSVCPVCTPYRASLLTGRYPLSTGMFLNDLYLPGEELCMAEIFKAAGYETAYIGKWHLDGHGRDVFIPKERRQGFDYWKVLECTHEYNESYYYAGADPIIRRWEGYDAYPQTQDARKYIREHAKGDRPFLLVMAYGGPHFPHRYAPQELKDQYPVDSIKLRPNVPEEMKSQARKEAQGYYAHCTALDGCIGTLYKTLKETGTAENTIFVFTSDHGEMLGSQGQPPKRKQRPWDESIRVPFLLRYPAVSGHEGRSVKAPINTPDILPTLLTLAGIDIPGTVDHDAHLTWKQVKLNKSFDRTFSAHTRGQAFSSFAAGMINSCMNKSFDRTFSKVRPPGGPPEANNFIVVEGEDLSRFVLDSKTQEDRAALFMNVSPFDWPDRKAFRGIRTSRYTYVRHPDGPWLMYDNQVDPYQMKNLIGDTGHVELQKELDSILQAKLKQTGDNFHPKQHYLEEWGYEVDSGGAVPYFKGRKPDNFKVQSPKNKLKLSGK